MKEWGRGGLTAGKWQNQGFNPSLADSGPPPLTCFLLNFLKVEGRRWPEAEEEEGGS